MVRGAVKLQEASASQVRCTCSMQGLKAQKTPSGRRHASADLATCAGHPDGINNPTSFLMIALNLCSPNLSAPLLLHHTLCICYLVSMQGRVNVSTKFQVQEYKL